jgi:two-component system phosphate regulon sensor histidine kinase PhoR
MKNTLFLKIFLGYAAVIALLAAAVTLFAPPLMRTLHVDERASGLEHLALLLEGQVLPYMTGPAPGNLEEFVTGIGKKTGVRITVIGADGSVLADSEKEPRDMENHFFRPEIQASLRGETQMSIRPSSTLKADMLYLSIPLRSGGRIVGALRLSVFMREIEVLLDALRSRLLRVAGLVTLVALVLAFFLTRSVTGPVGEVMDATRRVAGGDFDVTVSTHRKGEFRDFALGFNAMTGRLKDMFGETRLQNEEIRHILSSVREGVCVIDKDGRIALCNQSFHRIIGHEAPEGRHFWEVLRSSSAAEAVRKARESGTEAAGEALIGGHAFVVKVAPLAEGRSLVISLQEVA